MQGQEAVPAYSNLVTADEMEDSRGWLASMLGALGAGRMAPDVRPEVVCLRQGWGAFQAGRSTVGGPLCLAGQVYASGFGTHGVSDVRVRMPAGVRRLTGLCGIDDSDRTQSRTLAQVFSVEVEGEEVWNSGLRQVSSPPARFDIALDGRREFLLKVRGIDEYADADWVNLEATLADSKTMDISEVVAPVGDVFGFRCDGTPSASFLDNWALKTEQLPEHDGIVLRRITRTDPRTGLEVVCEIQEYTDFPVIEWAVRLRNTSGKEGPLIEDLRSMDLLVRRGDTPYLNYWNGDTRARDGYEPFRVPLARGEEYRFAPVGGRGTNHAWPYYNLEWTDSARGLIAVVGWPGQWASRFRGALNGPVYISAGQELTHFKLLPGEEVRTPLSVLMFYRGERERSQNLWRRWMCAHNMPRPAGKLPAPFHASSWGSEMHRADEASQIQSFDRWVEEGMTPDVWWMDAGWYPCGGDWYPTGTWQVDRGRFPRGLKFVSDHVHRHKTKSLVWFDPERVVHGTQLYADHPEWLLRACDQSEPPCASENHLLDLGNPQAWTWLVEYFSKLIVDEGIDIYRQDFNVDPLPYWRLADAPDRQGMTEIRHVEGYLAFWKELRRRFPDMLIDSCASGGRRNDLETMRLSVPLTMSDFEWDGANPDLPAKHAFHHTLFQWLPFIGSPVNPMVTVEPYAVRSAFAPCFAVWFDMRRRDHDYTLLRQLVAEWRRVSEYFDGDFYPLTPYSRDERHWMAWQFHRPEMGDGVVQAFRRAECRFASCHLSLRGLDESAAYEVTVLGEAGKPVRITGRSLAESGLRVETTLAPQAVVVAYQKVNGSRPTATRTVHGDPKSAGRAVRVVRGEIGRRRS